jgi:hypothetical protein
MLSNGLSFLYSIVLSCLLLIVYPSFVLVSLIRHIPFFTMFISRTAVLSTLGVWLVLFLFTSVSFIIIGGFVLLAIEVCTLIKQKKHEIFFLSLIKQVFFMIVICLSRVILVVKNYVN